MLERERLPNTLLVLSTSVLATVLVFLHNSDPLIFFMFPAFLLVAFRLGLPGTVVNILLATLLAIGFTIKGHGPLMLIPGEHMLLHRIVIAQILGAVGIFTMFPVAALLEEKQELRLSLAASEARFRNLAHADELTGLPNRRAFNLELENAWSGAFTKGKSIALLLIDADQFKQYNDVAGHLGGDDCLRGIARVTAEIVNAAHGIPARIGGEEFAAILPHTSRSRAIEIAEEIRLATTCLALEHPSSPSGIQTVSLGVASLVPVSGQRSISLIQLADQALYAAKISGRNQVACADLDPVAESRGA
jgi:diguanylate cyclase (GGDEF)-like protein